jgi:Ca-activated chloride channel family protein
VLRNVFSEIDKLEKTHMDVQRFTHTEDHYEPWALLLLGLLLLSLLLDYTMLRHIP